MNILITGANGYIGQRLISVLQIQGNHTLHCTVRNAARFIEEHFQENIVVHEIDFVSYGNPPAAPVQIDVAYYLMHSMSVGGDFEDKEARAASNFLAWLGPTHCRQIVYLSGIVNEAQLSKHLHSRLGVERILSKGTVPLTTLRAGIIVGSGSASFEIIRDLVEKLPIMVAPRWLNTKCQPIAVRNVLHFLVGVMDKPEHMGCHYDIAGPDVLSYKQMLLQFAEVRRLSRRIWILPFMTPRLSSYWLYFVTSTSYALATNLVNSMKVNVIAQPNSLAAQLGITLIPYRTAVDLAFQKIEQNMVVSSWKDAFSASGISANVMQQLQVPQHGCFKDIKWRPITGSSQTVAEAVWRIGGQTGWYYGNSLWKLRGFFDRLVGGVGLRRGRRSAVDLNSGDALDFWRVLVADKSQQRLLLYAEMKLPGEAWLEFKIMKKDNQLHLRQVATFRPRGIWGRLYWYSVLPFHYFIFNGMIEALVRPQPAIKTRSVG
ncbi:MAG: SDR family oxidoreductase [Bacteroidetes bacterium]|nr:MAG: SDR family oxidoreductase [Bacteroidota bacterium]